MKNTEQHEPRFGTPPQQRARDTGSVTYSERSPRLVRHTAKDPKKSWRNSGPKVCLYGPDTSEGRKWIGGTMNQVPILNNRKTKQLEADVESVMATLPK